MTSQQRKEVKHLNKTQELQLIRDLHAISQEQDFGKLFKVARAKADHFNPLVLSVPVGQQQEAKLLVTFHDYPIMSKPTIQPRGGEPAVTLAELVNNRLREDGHASMKLQDVVTLVRGVGDKLELEAMVQEKTTVDLTVSQPEKLQAVVADQPMKLPVIPTMQLLFASLFTSVALVSLLFSMLLTEVASLLALSAQGASLKTQEERFSEDESKSKQCTVQRHTSDVVLPGAPILKPASPKTTLPQSKMREGMSSEQLLSIEVKHVFLLESLLGNIIDDFSHYAPNEYAFVCSGLLDSDGKVLVMQYYPGEMEISTPVYCKLTDDFIETTVYDHIPYDHNLIVWGHIHPISGPSMTDAESFVHTAEWDREIAEIGLIVKRSLAMLINTYNHQVSFYDTHSMAHIQHELVSKKQMAEITGGKLDE